MKTLLFALLFPAIAFAQSCPDRIQLQPAPSTSRGEKIIYKSNWNLLYDRENTPEEGNHSQKGAALLVHYKAKKYIRNSHTLEVRDTNCKLIGRMGRYPRCTNVCGDYERWYLRAPGGSYETVSGIAAKSGTGSILVRLKGRTWAVVQNVFSDRESAK